MATSNAQRFLTQDGDDRNIALTMFWGTVLEAFKAKTLLWNAIGPEGEGTDSAPAPVVASKIVDAGKSWEFPIIGDDPTPTYHTPGTELLGQDVTLVNGTITIDDILVAHYDVPLDQTQLSHFDVIEPFARKLGRALAVDFDQKLFIMGFNAAYTAAVTNVHNGGNVVERVANTSAIAYPDNTTGAGNFLSDVAEMAQLLDEDNVPEDGRYLFATPYIRRILRNNTNIFDKDYGNSTNVLNDRAIGVIEGFTFMPTTNHIPSTNITTNPSKYNRNFAVAGDDEGEPVALILCGAEEGSSAIGYVAGTGAAGPIHSYREFDERRNTTFMKAQMMVGAGVLSPWSAGVIHVDTA